MTTLSLTNITKTYKSRRVLDLKSLEFKQGERVAIVGPNGSGKTTMLKIAAFLLKPDTGFVTVNGEGIDWSSRDKYRGHLGYMAQEPYFFRGSLLKNMVFAYSGHGVSKFDRGARIEEYISRLGLMDKLHRSPGTFSTGERKRAAIARALIREPSILILDEPFAFIDASSAVVLEESIWNLPDDRTVIFSTHDLSNAYKLADRIITFQGGMVSPWTPENIFRLTARMIDDGYELNTGSGQSVYYPGELAEGEEYVVSVNVKQVLVSKQQVETSARNSFRGVVRKIEQSGDRTVLVTAECGPDFNLRATLTERAVKELGTGVGDEVWMHFKSTAVYVHD